MTRKELPFLFMAIAAAAIIVIKHQGLWPRYFLFLYAWGLSFETITQNLWDYSPEIGKTRFSIPGTDINILLPLGWVFILSGAALVSSALWQYVLFTGIIGSTMEIVFYNLRFWQYNYEEKFLGLWRPYLPKVTVAGVPLQIIVSYFLVIGVMNWYFMQKLLR
jgi:hypothetical protein